MAGNHNSGRKPKAMTILRRMMQAEIIDEAHKSISFYVRVRDDESVPWAVRIVAAQRLEERAFGRAVQPMGDAGKVEDWRTGKTPDEIAAVEEAARIVNQGRAA